jgi:pimeloyl-ACP methyl ester carboxylesterase
VPAAEWVRWNLSATRAYRYVPDSLAGSDAAPVVVFFHGHGATPNGWQPFLAQAAEAAGAIVVAPKSRGVTWSLGVDDGIVEEVLERLATERSFDRGRVSLAGHSAGGAYASWLAHARPPTLRVAAVMAASASFLAIDELVDAGYRAPVRLLYGTEDPNYAAALPSWRAQWARLGVATAEDVVPGAGHSAGLTAEMFARGFVWLVAARHPAISPTCLPNVTTACLLAGRFRVTVRRSDASTLAWRSFTRDGAAVFGDGAGEVTVRMIDQCAKNGARNVLAASSATSAFAVEIVDTVSGASWVRPRADGSSAALVDKRAFLCPP